jgi:hypothetical protein
METLFDQFFFFNEEELVVLINTLTLMGIPKKFLNKVGDLKSLYCH